MNFGVLYQTDGAAVKVDAFEQGSGSVREIAALGDRLQHS
jgi:hypothetical protein